ncbi:MAG: hypothetical protein ACYCX4_01680 [Bacillota bacterium]
MSLAMTVDLSKFADIAQDIIPKYGIIQAAVANGAKYVREVWASAVTGVVLPGMTRQVYNDEYYQGLHTGESLQFPSPFHAMVVCTYVGAKWIEDGYASFDMKTGLLNGPKSRPLKDGKGRYNIVPFRHGTPTSNGQARAHLPTMPKDVYETVKQEGIYRDPGNPFTGAQLGQQSKMSGMINLQAILRSKEEVMSSNYTWKVGLYEGMRKIGKPGHTQYLTFRVVSTPRVHVTKSGKMLHLGSDPNSWIHPGLGPNPIVEAVYKFALPKVEEMILRAAEEAYGIE